MVPPGTYAGQLASDIILKKKCSFDSFKLFSIKLNKTLINIMDFKRKSKVNISNVLSKFHVVSVSNEMFAYFSEFLSTIDVHSKYEQAVTLLLQFLLNKCLFEILKMHNKLAELGTGDSLTAKELKITQVEEKIIRYVAGYIPYSISKKLSSMKETPQRKIMLDIMKTWNKADLPKDDLNILQYTNEWVDKVNRGGLFLVTDNVYRFIVRVEIVARTILNTKLIATYAGEDLREIIIEKLDADPFVTIGWDSLVRDIENKKLCCQLKRIIFDKWVTIRTNSFVKSWVDLVKFKHAQNKKSQRKVDSRAQPSLRKSLSTK